MNDQELGQVLQHVTGALRVARARSLQKDSSSWERILRLLGFGGL